jgi:hypothetical protein
VELSLRPSPLEALCVRRLGDGFFARAARFYAWGIAVSYGVALLFAPSNPELLLVPALETLAWIVGGVYGLAAARDPAPGADDAVFALARTRGFTQRDLAVLRFTAAVRKIGRYALGPGLALSLVPWLHARGADDFGRAVARTLGVLAFAITLSVVVAALARLSATLSPGRGRATLFGIVLIPHAAHSLWPALPSVPALLGACLEWLVVRGGA